MRLFWAAANVLRDVVSKDQLGYPCLWAESDQSLSLKSTGIISSNWKGLLNGRHFTYNLAAIQSSAITNGMGGEQNCEKPTIRHLKSSRCRIGERTRNRKPSRLKSSVSTTSLRTPVVIQCLVALGKRRQC